MKLYNNEKFNSLKYYLILELCNSIYNDLRYILDPG